MHLPTRSMSPGRRSRHAQTVVALVCLLSAIAWAADNRTALEPGWNIFSVAQDIELGETVSKEAEGELRILDDRRINTYITALGRRLAEHAPGEDFPYRFSVVNDQAINAFALPGGPIYINRGVIEAADHEAELAGVIAHEISHVALRHGTNQATKASAAQVPLAILGGLLGRDSTGGLIAQLGAGFALNSVLLKHSRTAESEADVLGTQILFDAGYDPRAMAQFFQTLEDRQEGGGPVEFFSNHPSPENRIERVNEELAAIGHDGGGRHADDGAFDDIVRRVKSLPVPKAIAAKPTR